MDVPDQIGLACFSNSELTELLNPSLTIIRQSAFEMGQVATELLLNLIESKRRPKEFTRIVIGARIDYS